MRTKLPTWPESTVSRILLVAICLLTTPQLMLGQKQVVPSNQNSPRRGTREALKKLDKHIDAAFLRGDRKLLARVLAERMISVSPQGDVSGKTEILKGMGSPTAK